MSDNTQDPRRSFAVFGKYTVLCRWAVGGMAEIFVARQTGAHGFDKLVALKLLRSELVHEIGFREMFFAEARTGALLSHPNIVHTFDIDEIDGHVYMAMEFINGESLSRVSETLTKGAGQVPIPLALSICRDVANALHYAHTLHDLEGNELNLVHRDVSPSNIMLTHDGGVKLLDFGIAKVSTAMGLTTAGAIKGKFSYLSPEQAQSEVLDSRSDVFSLGVVLWQLLTGKRAVTGDNELEIIQKVVNVDLPAPSTEGADTNEALDALVRKALERDREDRYSNAKAFGDALNKYLYENYPEYDQAEEVREVMKSHFGRRAKQLKHIVATTAVQPESAPQLVDNPNAWTLPSLSSATGYSQSGGSLRDMKSGQVRLPGEAGSHPSQSLSGAYNVQERPRNMGAVVVLLVLVILLGVGAAAWWFATQEKDPVRLVVSSEPLGADVMIDGKSAGKTPFEMEFPPNTLVNVVVQLSGYESYQEAVKTDEGGSAIHARLKRSEETGTLVIRSSPPAAAVIVDGQQMAEKTPLVLSGLWIGDSYTVIVTLEGYAPSARDVRFDSGNSKELQFELEATNKGFLGAQCEPVPCMIRVNGKDVGTTPLSSYEVAANSPISVQLMQGGRMVENETFSVAAGEFRLLEHNHETAEIVDVSTVAANDAVAESTKIPEPKATKKSKKIQARKLEGGSSSVEEADRTKPVLEPVEAEQTAGSTPGTSPDTNNPLTNKDNTKQSGTSDATAAKSGADDKETSTEKAAKIPEKLADPKPGDSNTLPVTPKVVPVVEAKVTLSVQVGSPRINGIIDQQSVRAVIKTLGPGFTTCYEKAYAKAAFKGKVDLEFVITGSGKTNNVKLSGDGAPALEGCFSSVISSLSYPKATASDATVDITVRLKEK